MCSVGVGSDSPQGLYALKNCLDLCDLMEAKLQASQICGTEIVGSDSAVKKISDSVLERRIYTSFRIQNRAKRGNNPRSFALLSNQDSRNSE